MIYVHPPYEDLLASNLFYKRRMQDGQSRHSVYYETHELYEIRRIHDVDWLVCPAGLTAQVIRTLKSYSIECDIEDLREHKLPDVDWSLIDEPREGQDVILAKIASCDMGQIEAPTGFGKTFLIVQICKMYMRNSILIIAPGISEAKTLRDRLLVAFPIQDVGQIGGGRNETDRRITVCVRASLMKVDFDVVDLILYDECHTAGGDRVSSILARARPCKIFGFTASPNMRSDGTDKLVESLIGPLIHVASYSEVEKQGNVVPMKVIFRPVPHGPAINSSTSTVINRNGLWRNDERNDMIAHDAQQAAMTGQTLVYVAVVEHGLELLRRLPGWAFVYSSMDVRLRKRYMKLGVLKEGEHPISLRDREEYQELFEQGVLTKVITTCWNQGVNFPYLQNIIRGDGQGSGIVSVQLSGRGSRTAEGKDMCTVIDYYDEFNKTLHRRALTRLRTYRSKGWDVKRPKPLGRLCD